jgi:DNA processing protein
MHSTDDDEILARMRLNLVTGVGPRLQSALMERFGNAAAVFQSSQDEKLTVEGLGRKLAAAISQSSLEAAQEELDLCRERSIQVLLSGSDSYPTGLAEIPDPPPILYCRGDLTAGDNIAVAIVGSRHCTAYGMQQAERFARVLAGAGVTIVSGLARGIDAAAHRGALEAGGRTIAVSATGLLQVYPPEHKELAERIAEQGAVVSESPVRRGATTRGIFPQRNRIISGLSLGVLIIEASRKSGALHTARHAMEQGRDVFALPGRVDSTASQGCLDLLKDGAILARYPDDILEGLGPLIRPVTTSAEDVVHTPRELKLNELERELLNLITTDPQHLDEILTHTGIEASRALATITILEMKRFVRRLPGGQIIRSV